MSPRMMSEEFDQCLKLLPRLSGEERNQLRLRLTYLGSNPIDEKAAEDSGERDLLLHCMVDRLKDRGIEFVTIPWLRKSPGYPAFCQKVPGVLKFFHQGELSRQDLRAFMALGIDLLIEDMQTKGFGVAGRPLMNHIHRIPIVMHREFPYPFEILVKIVRRKSP